MKELPKSWDQLSHHSFFFNSRYLNVLEESAPFNMEVVYIGIFRKNILKAVTIAQVLKTIKPEKKESTPISIKSAIQYIFLKSFASRVLFIGNNMLSGQPPLLLAEDQSATEAFHILLNAVREIKRIYKTKKKPVQLIVYKDFDKESGLLCSFPKSKNYYQYSTQPNMVFQVRNDWNCFEDYLFSLSKKYRDQYKRARKKAEGLYKKKMNLEEIKKYGPAIYSLYKTVASNASFNTFFLTEDHFCKMKQFLENDFLFYGYFEGDTLIAFNTLIKNDSIMETYFLGYEAKVQKEKMLYLNMLYDMVAYSINKGYKSINFGRTALEIKSSIGAHPEGLSGFIQHENKLIQKKLPYFFSYLEPKINWRHRHPFREG